jgi:energy-converting hydrogenase Eha subunit A
VPVYCDASGLIQLVVAVAVIAATSVVAKRLGLSMSAANAPMRTPWFWWTLAIFLAPMGVTSRVLFCDGLFLQLAIITAVAGSGIWLGERVLRRSRR